MLKENQSMDKILSFSFTNKRDPVYLSFSFGNGLSTCIHGQKLKSRCCPRWEIASQEDAPSNARESFTEFVHIFGRVEGIFFENEKLISEKKLNIFALFKF